MLKLSGTLINLMAAVSFGFVCVNLGHADDLKKALYLRGDALRAFALGSQQDYALTPLWGDEGSFSVNAGHMKLVWDETIESDVVVSNKDEICTKTEAGRRRCYAIALAPRELLELGCNYMLLSIDAQSVACLLRR